MSIKEKILKIMSLALEINPPEVDDIGKKRTAVFVNWSPHCNLIDGYVYYGGWDPSKSFTDYFSAATSSDDADRHLDAIIAQLEKIKAEVEAES